jgi:phospholipase D1/2
MLKDAAVRGVRVNIIVYKEVTQALTLSSAHTKHALEDLHPNIAVFRHPDHLPDRQELVSDITHSIQNLSLTSTSLAKMSKDTLKGLYGMNDDVILYWAHHEKLCLIDGQIAFMGGLDMCFGRWDTHQHALSDVHPSNINETVFPGQDYNNSRVLDFHNVWEWEQNQLDRMTMSRMGWSDISVGLRGPVVEDLRRHFVERWNFIFDSKYQVRQNTRYTRLALFGRPTSSSGQQPGPGQPAGQYQSGAPHPSQQQQASAPLWQSQQSGAPSQQQQGSAPQWQASSTGTSSYPPPPTQTSSSPQPQQQYNTSSSYQTGSTPSYPPPLGQSSTEQSHQQQHSSAPSYQAYNSGDSQGYQSSTAGQPSPSHASHQYSYTGDSFPPPPPGPPPSQSPAVPSYQPQQQQSQAPYYAPPPTQGSGSTQQSQQQSHTPYYPPPPGQEASHSGTRGVDDYHHGGDQDRGFAPKRFREEFTQYGNQLRGQLAGQIHQYQDRLTTYGRPQSQGRGNMSCQIVRSCAKWSNGSPIEHSIADAYAAIIKNSQHFVYIENQFFITATGDSQRPVKNKIGAAIVERILRAARAGQKYKIIVVIPSVPCFAGDLRDDETLGTRAIMEFQYNSINRGGHSIMELIAKEGFNPMEYIRFYNLRNYDRINNAGLLSAVERESGVHYEDARRQYDQQTAGAAGYPSAPSAPRSAFDTTASFQQYQQAAQHQSQGAKPAGSAQWDSVSSCYMLGGQDIRNVPWDGHPDAEIDAFVSEELYVHSKVSLKLPQIYFKRSPSNSK